MFHTRPFRFVWLPVAAAALLASAVRAEPVDPAGKVYAQAGKLKVKIQHVGTLKGEAPFSVIEYGLLEGVPEGGFRLTVDDGGGALPLLGSWLSDGKKLALTLDTGSFTADFEELIELEGELPPDSVSLSCEASAKGKVKLKKGVETAVTRAKVRCLASIEGFPDTIKLVFSFKGKGSAL